MNVFRSTLPLLLLFGVLTTSLADEMVLADGVVGQFRKGNHSLSAPFSTWLLRGKRAAEDALWKSSDKTLKTNHRLALLGAHNGYRSGSGASDMIRMDYNMDLEKHAQRYASKCIFKHSDKEKWRSDVAGYDRIGENLYVISTDYVDVTNVIKRWYDEISYYNYNTLDCKPGKMCGHYTQVVWQSSSQLGCGAKYCPTLKNVWFPSGVLVVCWYAPAGNYRGERPFTKGPACSACDKKKHPVCAKNLCASKEEQDFNDNSGTEAIGSHVWLLPALVLAWIAI